MHSRKERNLILDPGEFYILASKEAVQVLPYSAEMVPFDPLVGEFRVYHCRLFGYAGAGENRSRSRSRSCQGREIRIPRPWRIFRFTIFLFFLGINNLAQGRGDLESATLARVCFCGVFSRIFQGRTMGFESPARPWMCTGP
jgi:hypothetical protein